MINEKNLFEQGMLVSLNMGSYSGKKKLAKDQMGNLPVEIVRGVHDLFDKGFKRLLKEINGFDQDTRRLLRHRSVPFPMQGVCFIKSTKIEEIIEMLEARNSTRRELIQNAIDEYENAIVEFSEKYPEYYEHGKKKYLTKEQFEGRFYFKYQFLKISAPDENSSIISSDVYQTEMRKFRETIEDMKKEVIADIYSELLETTSRLKKQCTDGKPSQRTINTMNEYLKRIDDVYSDFLDRDDLKNTIESIRKQMLGVTAEELRDVDSTRENFRKAISGIVGEIQNLPDIPLKRALEF